MVCPPLLYTKHLVTWKATPVIITTLKIVWVFCFLSKGLAALLQGPSAGELSLPNLSHPAERMGNFSSMPLECQ